MRQINCKCLLFHGNQRQKSEGKQLASKESRVALGRGYLLVCTLQPLVDFLELYALVRALIRHRSRCTARSESSRSPSYSPASELFFFPPIVSSLGAYAALSPLTWRRKRRENGCWNGVVDPERSPIQSPPRQILTLRGPQRIHQSPSCRLITPGSASFAI